MNKPQFPENVARIKPGEPFSFACHPQIDCFTDCCRQLELALTPYDTLRLRRATQLSSSELLQKYIISEQNKNDIFPRFYLTMVDDGQASCVFVTPKGCSIYENRPGACRTYPLGRAVVRKENSTEDFFVLVQEPHCHGFQEKTVRTIESFCESQELEPYNRFNDMVTEIEQHQKIRNGLKLSESMIACYTLALYNLDTFRQKLKNRQITGSRTLAQDQLDNDEALLLYAFAWLKNKLFG